MAFLENQLPWLASSPLNLQGIPHEVPYEALRWIPKFGNNGNISAQEHLLDFSHTLTSLAIAHEDVVVKLLVHSFEGPAAEWFCSLPLGSITSWDDITTQFKKAFPVYLDLQALIDEFYKMRKHVHEFAIDFNVRFRKAFMQIPEDFRPRDRLALQIYCNALDPRLSYAVRHEKPYTLIDAMNVTIEIEQEMISLRLIHVPFQRQYSILSTEITPFSSNNFTFEASMQVASTSISALPSPPSPPSSTYQNHNYSHDTLVTELNGIHETMENLSKEILALQPETQQGGEDMKSYQTQDPALTPNVMPVYHDAYRVTFANDLLDKTYLDGANINLTGFVPCRSRQKEKLYVKQPQQHGVYQNHESNGNTSTSTKTCEDGTYIDDRDVGVPHTQANEISSSFIGTSMINKLHLKMSLPNPNDELMLSTMNQDDSDDFVVSSKLYSNLGPSTSRRSCDENVDATDVECQKNTCEIPTIDQPVINRCLVDTSASRNDTCQNDDT